MAFSFTWYLLVSILIAKTDVETTSFSDGSVLPRASRGKPIGEFRYSDGNVPSRVPRAMSMRTFKTSVVGHTWQMLYFLEQPDKFEATNGRQEFILQADGSVYNDVTYRGPRGCQSGSFTSIPKSRKHAIFESNIPTAKAFSREDRLFSRRPSHYIFLWLCDQEGLNLNRLLPRGGVCSGDIIIVAYVREFPLKRFPLATFARELHLETGLRFSDSRFTFRTGQECP